MNLILLLKKFFIISFFASYAKKERKKNLRSGNDLIKLRNHLLGFTNSLAKARSNSVNPSVNTACLFYYKSFPNADETQRFFNIKLLFNHLLKSKNIRFHRFINKKFNPKIL